MLAQLTRETQVRVRRNLALHLDPPSSSVSQRRRELSFLADLLRPLTPRPGWSFADTPRKRYDALRPPEAPSSPSLVARYGSWVDVCRLADGLIAHPKGQSRSRPQPRRRPQTQRRYSEQDVEAALRECAVELNRVPSRNAYQYWREATARRRPRSRQHPSAVFIVRLYAERGGWRSALENADLVPLPRKTVRVTVETATQAAELTASARAAGLIAAHAGTRRCVEILGTLAADRQKIVELASRCSTVITLSEPSTRTVERIDRRPR